MTNAVRDTRPQSIFDQFYLERLVVPTIPYILVIGGVVTALLLTLIAHGAGFGLVHALAMVLALILCVIVSCWLSRTNRPPATVTASVMSLAIVAMMAELSAYLHNRGPATGLYLGLLLAVLCAGLSCRWWHLVLTWIFFTGPVITASILNGTIFRQPIVQVGSFTIVLLVSTTITYLIGMRFKWSYFHLLHEARLRARHDALTGVLNHLGWQEMIARTTTPTGVVVFFDIDDFGAVNDQLGHRVGDQVLVRLAEALRDAMGPAAVVARLGGDEFGVFLPESGSVSVSDRLHDLRRLLDQDATWSGLTVSHGIGSCGNGRSIIAGWTEADINLNRAKRQRPSVRPLSWPPTLATIASRERALG